MVNVHDFPDQVYMLGPVDVLDEIEDSEVEDDDSDSDSKDEDEYLDPEIAYAPQESDAGTIGSAGDVGEQEEQDGHTGEAILDALFQDGEDVWGDDDFGLEELEQEILEPDWPVVEHVGFRGLHLTLDLWINPYTPLYWDQDTDA
jgi:hypothetical protein